MKKRKENDVPDALLQNQEPAKKRSKLVLPSPQITDQVGGRAPTRRGMPRIELSIRRVLDRFGYDNKVTYWGTRRDFRISKR